MRNLILPFARVLLRSALLTSALLTSSAALAAPLEAELERLSSLEGEAYLEARRALLAQTDARALAARVAAAAWSDASWRADAVAASALAHLEKPGAAERLAKLPGLDPARYLEMRRPEPMALRDLRGLLKRGEVSAPQLAELLDKTLDGVRFSKPGDFPARVQKDAPRLILEERAALVDGLLLALAGSGHPVAGFTLREAALDEELQARHRAVAASGLGQTRAPFALATLELLLGDDDVRVRESAAIGLGRLASPAAVERLSALSREPAAKELRVAVTGALGRAGSRFAHRAAPSKESERVRAAASAALVDALVRAEGEREVQAAIEALSVVAHESARPALAAATAGASDDRYGRALRRLDRALARGR